MEKPPPCKGQCNKDKKETPQPPKNPFCPRDDCKNPQCSCKQETTPVAASSPLLAASLNDVNSSPDTNKSPTELPLQQETVRRCGCSACICEPCYVLDKLKQKKAPCACKGVKKDKPLSDKITDESKIEITPVCDKDLYIICEPQEKEAVTEDDANKETAVPDSVTNLEDTAPAEEATIPAEEPTAEPVKPDEEPTAEPVKPDEESTAEPVIPEEEPNIETPIPDEKPTEEVIIPDHEATVETALGDGEPIAEVTLPDKDTGVEDERKNVKSEYCFCKNCRSRNCVCKPQTEVGKLKSCNCKTCYCKSCSDKRVGPKNENCTCLSCKNPSCSCTAELPIPTPCDCSQCICNPCKDTNIKAPPVELCKPCGTPKRVPQKPTDTNAPIESPKVSNEQAQQSMKSPKVSNEEAQQPVKSPRVSIEEAEQPCTNKTCSAAIPVNMQSSEKVNVENNIGVCFPCGTQKKPIQKISDIPTSIPFNFCTNNTCSSEAATSYYEDDCTDYTCEDSELNLTTKAFNSYNDNNQSSVLLPCNCPICKCLECADKSIPPYEKVCAAKSKPCASAEIKSLCSCQRCICPSCVDPLMRMKQKYPCSCD